jgi:hypothetical protein
MQPFSCMSRSVYDHECRKFRKEKTVWLPDLSCDILASFIETVWFLWCDIRFVTITQIEKGRHNMLCSALFNEFYRFLDNIQKTG